MVWVGKGVRILVDDPELARVGRVFLASTLLYHSSTIEEVSRSNLDLRYIHWRSSFCCFVFVFPLQLVGNLPCLLDDCSFKPSKPPWVALQARRTGEGTGMSRQRRTCKRLIFRFFILFRDAKLWLHSFATVCLKSQAFNGVYKSLSLSGTVRRPKFTSSCATAGRENTGGPADC